jgi:ATP-dependent DNA helicase RecQ
MTTDILAELGLPAAQAGELNSHLRSRLLNFLMRWEHCDALHACLDFLVRNRPGLVSLLDLRVRAYLAQNRPDEALAVMQQRLDLRTSAMSQILLTRIHMAQGEWDAARQAVHALIQEQPANIAAWELAADIELARGDVDAAFAANRRVSEINSQSRAYLLGMVAVYQARNDWVSASAYAVRLLRSGVEEGELPIQYLRRLRDFFRASGEATHVADIDNDLARRYADESAALKAALSEHTPGARPARRTQRAPAPAEPTSSEALPTFESVPVSDEERARILQAARQLFGFDALLPGQVETIACVLRGEDVLTILPTGGGKSLCYQLPALMAERGVTLVVSPLIALMKDQLDSLPAALQRQATTLNSSLQGDELRARLDGILAGHYKLVYAAPERLRQPPFLHALKRAGLERLVIDEAHCVSLWGHDFRPDYFYITQAREELGRPPLFTLTATAPTRVRRDILHRLGPMRIVAGDVTRSNLQLEVMHARNADEKLSCLVAFCQAQPGSGIVYSGTRDRCEALAALLRRHGVSAAHYHAGRPDRDRVQDDFMAGRVRVIAATVAFGLGIDKPDIRFIVHAVPPPSLEAYYQEAGRAGRDGLPARCLLMYAASDRATLTRHAHQDAIPVEFLRQVYRAIKTRLKDSSAGRIAEADLQRDLATDDSVRVRVAISMLEEAGLLRRGPDAPRAAIVCLATDADAIKRPELAAFCRAAHLRPGQALTLDVTETARRASLPQHEIERVLLAGADDGWLTYHPAGRDLLLELVSTRNVTEQVAALLERYETAQAQRVDEITAYAQTGRCRHGYLNAYLGGRVIERCSACDNCVELSQAAINSLPDEREQMLTILRCIRAKSWGRVNLTRILRGDKDAPPNASGLAEWGALAFRSEAAVGQLLDRLESEGLLLGRRLDHGGVSLELTQRGRSALLDSTALDRPSPPSTKTAPGHFGALR